MADEKREVKVRKRSCWCCGESLGFIEDRFYEREDTCGKPACEREARDAERQKRDDAHAQLDADRGWERW